MGTNAEQTLIIRSDASSQMGIGHVMRCLALAQAWQLEGGHVIFLSSCESESLRQRIVDAGIEFMPIADPHPDPRDLQTTLEVLQTYSVGIIDNQKSVIENRPWLVLDGYHFDPVYQQAVRDAGYHLMVVDDMAHLPAYHADILLNQNLGAENLNYNCDSNTTLLLGPRYALLRQEFLAWRGWQRETPKVARKVLVTMGGGDPDNVTLKVIHALELVRLDGLEVIVVVGGNNPHFEILQSAIHDLQFKIRLERDATNMPELMAWADVSIAGGGSTCWELLFMGFPSMVLVLAENQRAIADELDQVSAVVNLGWFSNVSEDVIAAALINMINANEIRDRMGKSGQQLVDGFGVKRIVQTIDRYITR